MDCTELLGKNVLDPGAGSFRFVWVITNTKPQLSLHVQNADLANSSPSMSL